jgi:SNF2 family DNA or RNA helicase
LLEKTGITSKIAHAATNPEEAPSIQALVEDLDKERPYQKFGTAFLYERKRALLFDQMGLGKTPQTILSLRIANSRHNLVVCPTMVFRVWENEIKKWWPDASSCRVFGPERERTKGVQEWKRLTQTGRPYFVLTTYPTLAKLNVKGWNSITFDEPHRNGLANKSTAVYKAAEFHSSNSERLFFVTGTPMKKGVEQLWGYLHLIDPKQFSSFWKFVGEHIATMRGEFGGIEYLGVKDPAKLRRLLAQYGIRRLKKDVLSQLPPKQRLHIPIEMPSNIAKIYKELDSELIYQGDDDQGEELPTIVAANRGGLRTRLRQLLCCPTMLGHEIPSPHEPVIIDLVKQAADEGERFAVFTPYVDAAMINSYRVQEATGIPCFYITGRRKPAENDKALDDFRKNKPSVLYYTTQMGVGWDIAQECSMAAASGLCDAPDDMLQAEDRLHRFHTVNPVNIYYPIVMNSVESQQMLILDNKTKTHSLILDRAA